MVLRGWNTNVQFVVALVLLWLLYSEPTLFGLVGVQGNERGEWLSNLRFAVFGLGNRQYKHFNKVAWCPYIDLIHIICTVHTNFAFLVIYSTKGRKGGRSAP
jgi:hypothetical protein